MRNLKKFMTVFMALALVLGTVGLMPVMQAKATPTPPTPVVPDYTVGIGAEYNPSTGLLEITDGSDDSNVLYIAQAKAAITTWDATKPNDGEWGKLKWSSFVFTDEVNISSFSPKKDAFLYVKTDLYAKPLLVKITKNDAKARFSFDYSKDAAVGFFMMNNAAIASADLAKYEINTGDGWSVLSDGARVDVLNLTLFGGTVNIRVKGAEKAGTVDAIFAGAPARVKVPRQAAAPKVAVDGKKETIKYGKNLQVWDYNADKYADLAAAGETLTFDKLANNTGTALDKGLVFGTPATGIYALVRTKATDKRPASQMAVVYLAAAMDETAVKDATFKTKNLITYTHVKNSNGKTTSMEIKNASDYDIQYIVVAPPATGAPVVPADPKWITVKAKSGVSKLKNTDGEKNIIFRIASMTDAATKVNSIPSVAIVLGIEGDADVPLLTDKWEASATTTTTTTTSTTSTP